MVLIDAAHDISFTSLYCCAIKICAWKQLWEACEQCQLVEPLKPQMHEIFSRMSSITLVLLCLHFYYFFPIYCKTFTCALNSFSWAFVLLRKWCLLQSVDVKAWKALSRLSFFLKFSITSLSSDCRPLIGRNLRRWVTLKSYAHVLSYMGYDSTEREIQEIQTSYSSCESENPSKSPESGWWTSRHIHIAL